MDNAFIADQARRFRHFAEHECPDDPLYIALCTHMAEEPSLLALMAEIPAEQRRPNLLLAALHERVLAGVPQALRDYYPSVGGRRRPDAALPGLLREFVEAERETLLQHLRQRATQTNETGRCAVLWPALGWLSRRLGAGALALFDFGSSAGLNQGVDRYGYDYGGWLAGELADGHPRIRCEWQGAPPSRADAGWRLAERLGVDLSPIDLRDGDALRWLRACLWPHDRERAQRFEQAVALALLAGDRVEAQEDGLGRLERWLDELPAGVQPVLFNSWVLAYLQEPALHRHHERVRELVERRGLAWICAETEALHPAALERPARPGPLAAAQGLTLWSAHWRGKDGAQSAALAWSHPHGRWLHWTAPPA